MAEPMIDFALVPPLEMSEEQLDSVKQLALFIQRDIDCDYVSAIMLAYFRWHDMIELEDTKH